MYERNYHFLRNKYYTALKTVFKSLNGGTSTAGATVAHDLEKSTTARLRRTPLYILSGISGSGKTAVGKLLEARGFKKVPNVTTRPRRPEERSDDFVFTDEATFWQWEKEGKLLNSHQTNGVWHGILKKHLLELQEGKRLRYADKSVSSMIALFPHFDHAKTTLVYVLTPSFEELYQRIVSREEMRRERGERYLDAQEIFRRFEEEIAELTKSAALPYGYVVNDNLARVEQVLFLTPQ